MNESPKFYINKIPKRAPTANPINIFITYFELDCLLTFYKTMIIIDTINPIKLTPKDAKIP